MQNNTLKLFYSYHQAKKSRLHNIIARFKHTNTLKAIFNSVGIEYATINNGTGFYKGNSEPSYQIYIIGIDKQKALELAQAIKTAFCQDSVMLDYNSNIEFI
jgi:hypothetical protein